ncbi:acyl dehydratase [Propionibacteriaceae bacterium ES.041]|uniref:FAS1-like dehydratase domain-containing protein n=1 Tax=Enemella evansiae TaxID=2016499 RepID=UPI000B9668CE|nr:MaoC family dehydratase N-terminal domain-containing protein [Enemella evansiae]OYN94125.1 hypothetical protein CGZ96_19930 [Enemella evansiae]PFG68576.1 acyl dehydratase [Propionibacteriaceae bacterium ES.041]
MPISSEHVGRSYPPSAHYQVTAGKIAEFAAALGEDVAAHPDQAPPTFGVLLAGWQALFDDAELGLSLRRTMHTEQKFSYRRPLRAGDEVVATTTIAGVRVRGQVDMITVESSLDSTQGEHLGTVTASLFHTRPAPEALSDREDADE